MLLRRRRIEKQLTTKIALKRKQQLAQQSQSLKTDAPAIDLNASAEEVHNQRVQRSSQQNSKIKKMMEKMSWQGKGLGKQEQGILNPLITKKAAGSAMGGIIVESNI